MIALDEEAFNYAIKRIEEFTQVQQGREWNDQIGAVNILLPSLGFDEDLKDRFNEWLNAFVGPGFSGEIMLGLLIGLFINQYNQESSV